MKNWVSNWTKGSIKKKLKSFKINKKTLKPGTQGSLEKWEKARREEESVEAKVKGMEPMWALNMLKIMAPSTSCNIAARNKNPFKALLAGFSKKWKPDDKWSGSAHLETPNSKNKILII